MFEEFEQALPAEYKGLFRLLILPVSWLPAIQSYIMEISWQSDVFLFVFLKRIFLFVPALAVIVGLWCTMLSVYTILFRSQRIQFIGAIMVSWWDILRCTWYFWAGMGKFLWTLFGSLWGALRLCVSISWEIIRESFELPFVLTGSIARNLRQPGVPWLAFMMTIVWTLIEATVFTYILTSTFSEILTDLVGRESHVALPVFLFIMLFFMVAGSFACMHVLIEAIDKKDIKNIIIMSGVEFFVMGVEVMFLYRELVDSLTPWIAQQTGLQMGIVPVIIISSGAWFGIRGMVWFLFARFGTPTLLAFIARQRFIEEASSEKPAQVAEERLDVMFRKIKSEQEWFHSSADSLLSAAVLPIFQIVASGLNFGFVLFSGRPLFSVPFQSLADVKETKILIETNKKAIQG
ncbi:hypothetical protein BVX98_06905 [bacterium F11]|nr:hypothetical protein BVX98_06905 [bacterium F11]